MAKRKRTNNHLQNIAYKTKDRVTRTPLKFVGEIRVSLIISTFEDTYSLIYIEIETIEGLAVIMKQFTVDHFSLFHNARTNHTEFEHCKL